MIGFKHAGAAIRAAIVLIVLVALPAIAVAQSWDEITESAVRIDYDGEYGVASGQVAGGVASFVFTAPFAGPITAEVQVTDVRMGLEYEDEDSIMGLFDADGYLIEENDDGPHGWESMINGAELPEPGTYYLVVTTHPGFVALDDRGQYLEYPDQGLSDISFDIVLQAGEAEYVGDYDEMAEPVEIAYELGDVFEVAVPLEVRSAHATGTGQVGGGISVFEVYVDENFEASIEVVITSAGLGADSVLTVVDADGYVLAEDDDSGVDGASRIDGMLLTGGSIYYVVVSAWPGYAERKLDGELIGFPGGGDSEFRFDLEIREASPFAERDPAMMEAFDIGESAMSFDAIVASAVPVEWNGDVRAAGGMVWAGYEAFRIDAEAPMDVTIEVMAVDPGAVAEFGADSMLSLFHSDGLLIASDDDSGGDGAAKLEHIRLAARGSYYAVVTSYPNAGEIDDDGYFSAIYPDGGSFIDFWLVVTEE